MKKEPNPSFNHKETKVEVPEVFFQENTAPFEGSAIEDYEIVRQIGSGATGIVYEAYHKHLKRRVAVKILKTHLCKSKIVLERFSREGATIAKLKHENIATIYDFVNKGDMHYIVMEFIEGTVLEDIVKKLGKLPIHESVNIIMGVLRGLNIAHENNIIHRDVKPSNIIISSKGIPVLFDFGLAKLKDEAKNISNIPIGTPSYMAPEQFHDRMKFQISHKTDFFSLGVMFYEMLTGELPFKADSFSGIMHRIITEEVVPPSRIDSQIPKNLNRIILKLLEKDPGSRYKSAREILEDLDCFKKNQPLKNISHWPLNTIKRYFYRFILTNTYFLTTFALLVSFVVAFFIFSYFEKQAEKTSWKKMYSMESVSFQNKGWDFFEGYHENSLLSSIQKKQMIIPVSRESLIINFPYAVFGLLNAINSSEITVDCLFQQVVHLDPGQPSRTGVVLCSHSDRLSGYIFYVSRGNAYFAKNFIENIIIEKPVPPDVYIHEKLHIVMRKEGSEITVELNGEPFLSYQDFMPLSSPENGFCGIIGENVRLKFDHMDVFSLGMPQKTSPVIIGQKLMELGEYEKALAIYKEIISDIQDEKAVTSARYQVGIIDAKLGDDPEAIKAFQYLIDYSSNPVVQSKSYYQKAMIFLRQHNMEQAEKNFLSARNIYPSHAIDLNILAGVFNYINTHPIDSLEEAKCHEDVLNFMFRYFPDFKASFIREPKKIALYYFSKKEYEKSRRVFKTITQRYPFKKDYCAWSYLMIGETYRFEGFLDLAIRAYDEVTESYPDFQWIGAWAMHRKADILVERGDNEQAVKIFQEIIKKYKQDIMAKYRDGMEATYEVDDIVYKSYLEIQKLIHKY